MLVIVRQGRAVAVRTQNGDEIAVRRAVLADVGAPALFLKMLPARAATSWLRQCMRRFRYGWGIRGIWTGLTVALVLIGAVLIAAWHRALKRRALSEDPAPSEPRA